MEFLEGIEAKTTGNIAKCRRYRFVVGSVFVALTLIIAVTVIVTKNRDFYKNVPENQKFIVSNQHSHSNRYTPSNDFEKDHPNPHINLHGKLTLLIDGDKLVSFDYKSSHLSLLYRTSNNSTIIAFDAHVGKYIYRSEKLQDEKYVIAATALIEHDVDFVLEKMQFKPIDVILDRITGNLYAIDKDARNLVVISLRTGCYDILLADLFQPREIVLDSEEGVMFILQLSHSILRTNMDGTGARKIIVNDKVTAITIDSSGKRVYWIDKLSSVQSSDYEGQNPKSFFIDIMRIERLAVLDNRLFWTWSSFQNTTNLFACKINENHTYENHSTYNVVGNVTLIRGYSINDLVIADPCRLNNCEQLCLLSGRNMSVCHCPVGWKLNVDQHSCEKMSDQDVLIA